MNPSDLFRQTEISAEGSLFLGMDIGTTTVSAVILDTASGETPEVCCIPNASDLPSRHPWEKIQDAENLVSQILDLVRDLTLRFPGIRAIGVTGQMHGILYVDAHGKAASPLYTWQDGRAGTGDPSPCERLFALTGYRTAPGYGIATHYALLGSNEVPADGVKICTVMDYLVMKLTGRTEPLMHSSDAASLGLWKTDENRFDTDAFIRAGMDPGILPGITGSAVIAGTYGSIPVSVAIGDNQASFFGSVRDPGREALANFGTGSQISLMCRSTDGIPTDSAMEIRPFLEGTYLASGSALCGGRAYAILERFFRKYALACGLPDTEQYEIMNRLAMESLEKGQYLETRTTFCGTRNDPGLRGSITGISEELLTPEAMVAGVLHGMASELHDLFLRIPHDGMETLVLSGNAVRKNPALRKTLRMVFGMETCTPLHREEAAFGAAMFAALASGCAADPAVCIRYDTAE